MASLTVRNIPDEVMEKLRAAATEQRRSVNSQVIHWLEECAGRQMSRADNDQLLAGILALREEGYRRHGMGSDSAKVIRRMRDARTAHWRALSRKQRGKTGT